MELEGLRGIAAVVVVLYHIMTMFYPGIAYGVGSIAAPVQNMRFEDNLYGSPLNVFLSGGFAVGIFFILSGFVLSIGFFQTGKESIVKKLATKRYLRLMLPALASVLLSFMVLSLHFNAFRDEATLITHSGTVGEWGFMLNIFDALYQGTFGIFFGGFVNYNPVLWTMTYEFIGSFIVFMFLLLFGKSSYRWGIYLLLGIATFSSWYFGFILGALLADLYANNLAPFRKQDRRFAVPALVVGLVAGGYPFGSTQNTIYNFLHIPALTGPQNNALYISVGAALVVIAVLSLPKLSNFFARPKVSQLGKYTYSLYLTHYITLVTLCSAFFVFFSRFLGFNKAAVLSVLLTLPVIVALTWVFEKYIDQPSIRLASFVGDVLEGRRTIQSPQKISTLVQAIKTKMRSTPTPEIEEE